MLGKELRSWEYLKSLHNRELRSYPQVSKHIYWLNDCARYWCLDQGHLLALDLWHAGFTWTCASDFDGPWRAAGSSLVSVKGVTWPNSNLSRLHRICHTLSCTSLKWGMDDTAQKITIEKELQYCTFSKSIRFLRGVCSWKRKAGSFFGAWLFPSFFFNLLFQVFSCISSFAGISVITIANKITVTCLRIRT